MFKRILNFFLTTWICLISALCCFKSTHFPTSGPGRNSGFQCERKVHENAQIILKCAHLLSHPLYNLCTRCFQCAHCFASCAHRIAPCVNTLCTLWHCPLECAQSAINCSRCAIKCARHGGTAEARCTLGPQCAPPSPMMSRRRCQRRPAAGVEPLLRRSLTSLGEGACVSEAREGAAPPLQA